MEVGQQAKLSFNGVDIYNVRFNAFAQRPEEVNVDVKCVPKVYYPFENKNIFHILMDIEVKDNSFFIFEMQAVGAFQIMSEVSDEIRKGFVNSNSAAIMFPYIRSFISTFTANIGNVVGILVLPPQFFNGELEEVVADVNTAQNI